LNDCTDARLFISTHLEGPFSHYYNSFMCAVEMHKRLSFPLNAHEFQGKEASQLSCFFKSSETDRIKNRVVLVSFLFASLAVVVATIALGVKLEFCVSH